MAKDISITKRDLSSQLTKIRKLTQPYFLPYTSNNGWLFILLLFALIFCVVPGTVLFVVTGLINLLSNSAPDLTKEYLSGVQEIINKIWNSNLGLIGTIFFLFGIGSFASFRSQLRQKRWIPWLFLGLVLLMLLSVNGINAGISFLVRDITNGLINQNASESYRKLWILGICFIAALPIRSFQFYLSAKLQLLWREWLSNNLIDNYLTDRTYYILNPNDEDDTEIDNPDQRITEDAKDFTAQILDLSLNIFDSILTFTINIGILLSISKNLTVALVFYAGILSVLIIFASKKLFKLNFDQLKYEANFRYGLVHVRNNAESIAFYSGEDEEYQEVNSRLKSVVKNFNLLIIWEALLRVLQRSTIYGSVFIPFIILSGPLLAGNMNYGEFSQARLNYQLLEGSLFFIIYKIEALARFSASIGRLEGFQSSIKEVKNLKSKQYKNTVKEKETIYIRNVNVETPDKSKLLVKDLNLSVEYGESILVVGPSGCGKTSLLRVISGLWSTDKGEIFSPQKGDLLFIPQKPYMTLGSLREQLCYPLRTSRFSDEHLQAVLKEVQLANLIERYPDLDIKQDWQRILSQGEQQRLAFARLLLNSPKFVILDEATSALDIKTEHYLYNLLKERNIALVSVGHRPTLKSFHDNVLELSGKGNWSLIPSNNFDFNSSAN